MRLFILPPSFQGQEIFRLEGKDYHYLVRVLRKRVGDSFNASDGAGTYYYATVEEIAPSFCILRVQRRGPLERPFPEITLFQCIPKGKKLDLIVRQAVELGVSRVVPVISKFSVPRWESLSEKIQRLQRIAKEAAQQCGSLEVPKILPPLPLEGIVEVFHPAEPDQLGLFFHQAPLARTTLHQYLSLYRKGIALVIGPEGGLSEEEVTCLQQRGFSPAYLGPSVLRTETAPVFALAAVQILLLEKTAWKLQQEP
ncbi:MAG: 16S rRNA (uracil(1498)-N(3))-methyltransferase [Spirochaetes bacterium]|nr:16S rRNA (uracil(1498)-N(3))-methyltransferase [Spirochaetota bacterium]